MNLLGDRIIRFRWLILAATLIITACLGFFIRNIKVNPDIFSYLPDNDRVAQLFDHVGIEYGGNYQVMIGLETTDIFCVNTLQHISILTDSLSCLKGVGYVTSLINVLDIRGGDWGIEIGNLVDPYNMPRTQEEVEVLRQYVMGKDMYRGAIVSEDATLTLILVKIIENGNKLATAGEIKDLVLRQGFPEKYYFGGLPIFMLDIQQIILNDLEYLAPLCLAIIAGILFAGFWSIKKTIIPLLVVFISIIWTIGLMALLRIEITIISNITPVVLIAVGSAYSIHVINRINETGGHNNKDAIRQALAYIIIPVFLAAITTVMGFLSFLAGSYLIMIRIFGLFTAIGVLFAMVLSVTFTPALLAFTRNRGDTSQTTATSKTRWLDRVLASMITYTLTRPGYMAVAWLLIVAAGIVGSLKIERNVDIIDYFKKDSPARETETVFREKLTGSYPVYVLVNGNIQSPRVLSQMRHIAKYMEAFPEIKFTQSVADLIEEMNDVMGEGKVIPDDEAKVQQLWFLLQGQKIMEQIVTFDMQEALITANFNSTDSKRMQTFVRQTDEYLGKINSADCQMALTGAPSLYKRIDESLINSQLQSLLYASAFVLLIVSILFRSLRRGLIAIIPILVTLTVLFGVMGFGRIPLDIATVLVGSVSIGIGIDYAIHMIVHVNYGLRRSQEIRHALEQAAHISGKAVFINMLSVSAGFIVLMFSDLIPLQRFGLLVAVTMLISGFGSLTLLPALLHLDHTFKLKYQRKKKQ